MEIIYPYYQIAGVSGLGSVEGTITTKLIEQTPHGFKLRKVYEGSLRTDYKTSRTSGNPETVCIPYNTIIYWNVLRESI